jgi:hypothetical protein
MYITKIENDYALLHQMVPLAAAVFLVRSKNGPPCRKFYSRSYVQYENKGKYILAQLYFYKCTTSPIHALLIDIESQKFEVKLHRNYFSFCPIKFIFNFYFKLSSLSKILGDIKTFLVYQMKRSRKNILNSAQKLLRISMFRRHNNQLVFWTQLLENIKIILCGQEGLQRTFQMQLNQVLLWWYLIFTYFYFNLDKCL